MSEDDGGSKPEESDGRVEPARDIPKTRKHGTVEPTDGEPPSRASAFELTHPDVFPDDTTFTARIRSIDRMIGAGERLLLLAMLATIVGIGAAQALATKLFDHSFPWSFDFIRGGTFAIAMIAGAYASQQASQISMDLVTRKVSPRTRLAMRVVLGLVTLIAMYLLAKTGLRMVELTAKEGGDHTIPAHWLALLIPIGGLLIAVHTILRSVIDIDYFRRRKLPPEQIKAH
ncbi:MAG: TRAP transporter small permease [Deltaproteobacteria bacterium]|nr:TRAP transporter small permease [Deltaproteobacteria bacterium]